MALHRSTTDSAAPQGPAVLLLGPGRGAVSGVSTHLNSLFASSLAQEFSLHHFQVGSEGRNEGPLGRLLRLLFSPLALAMHIVATQALLVHINTSLNRRAFWRDLAYLLVARLCGARVLYQVHGGFLPQQFCAATGFPPGLLRVLLKIPDAIVVLAHCELLAYRQFLPDRPVLLLPNSIDCTPYQGLARPARAQSDPLHFIYIGRLAREKGLFETVEGLAQARDLGVPATLTIAGNGPEEASLKALVQSRGLEGQVRFMGPVFDGAKRALLATADVQLLPSYAEGLPYALLEGMAAGVPPITTRVGGIPDVVTEGIHGLFVPLRDGAAIGQAMILLAADRPALERMGEACMRRIFHAYSADVMAGEFARLYRALCYLGRARWLGES